MGMSMLLNAASGRGNLLNTISLMDEMDQRDRAQRKEDVQDAAAQSYLNNLGAVGSPEYRQTTFTPNPGEKFSDQIFGGEQTAASGPMTIGHSAPAQNLLNQSELDSSLARAVGPRQFLAMKMAAAQKANEPYDLAPGASRFQGGKMIATNPKAIEAGSPVGKAAEDLKNGLISQQQFDAILAKETTAPGANNETWRVMTPAEVAANALNPGGAYKISNRGNIEVITQPKQDNPTESQQKFAFNAKRISDALGTVQRIATKDPNAVSSMTLNATDGIPGLDTIGRKITSGNSQIVRNNLGDALDAIITLGTGAAYTKEQLVAAKNAYLPQPGEKPAVIADKYKKLVNMYENAQKNARTAGVDLPPVDQFAAIYGQKGNTPAMPPGWSAPRRVR
jgi:hypothetical protein